MKGEDLQTAILCLWPQEHWQVMSRQSFHETLGPPMRIWPCQLALSAGRALLPKPVSCHLVILISDLEFADAEAVLNLKAHACLRLGDLAQAQLLQAIADGPHVNLLSAGSAGHSWFFHDNAGNELQQLRAIERP